MEPIKRKRVTRVGSGAFSIYLPKKWIDSWTPAQQKDREVDLHLINEALLIVPVLTDQSVETTIDPDKRAVRRWLLSCYLRGKQTVRLLPEGGRFDNDAVAAGRDFLRHLDERLVATCTPEEIGFTLNADLPPPAATGADILAVMGAKVIEMVGLARDAVATYGTDPDRTLHALGLLQATYAEDVSRYFHQAMRMVATIELPLTTVTDFQVLDLVAADLHRMADHAQRIAVTILREYGLGLDDLAYPRDHLLERMGERDPLKGVARDMVRGYDAAFAEAERLLRRLMDALTAPDIPALADLIGDTYRAQDAIQERIFQTVTDHWGTADAAETEAAMAGFTAYQISVPISNLFGAVGTTARHGLGLLTAAEADA